MSGARLISRRDFAFICLGFSLLFLLPIGVNWLRGCHHVWDLGIFAQAIQQITESNLNPILSTGRGGRIFNDHFDPILAVLSPLGKFGDPTLTLLWVEWAFVLGTGLLLHFRPPQAHGFFRSGMFLFSIATFSAITYPVHPATWSILPLAFFFHFSRTSQWIKASLCALTLLLFKEEYVHLLGGLGFTLFVLSNRTHPRRFSLTLMGIALSGWLIVFYWGPTLFGGVHDYSSELLMPWKADPWAEFNRRAWGNGWSTDLLSTLAPLFPFWILHYRFKKNVEALPFFTFLLLTAIRFVTGKHGFHYQIPLILCAVEMTDFTLLGKLQARRSMIQVRATALLLLLIPLVPKIGKYTVKTLFLGGTRNCPASPTRIAGIRQIQLTLDAQKGTTPLIVQGQVLPRFITQAPQGDIFPLETGSEYSFESFWLISERPTLPNANFWPLTQEDGKRRLARLTQGHRLIEDRSTDDFLFQLWVR